jgi:branched-chain amino acid transport system ATP-binding protein
MRSCIVLEVEQLSKRFGGLKAISDLSFRIKAGEFVGIIGPNGAGKSTLLNLITGFHKPTSGSVRFEGRDIQGMLPFAVCRLGIARTFQVVRPFPEMSVEENVMTGALFSARGITLKMARERIRTPLELTGLWAKRHVLGGELPIGEKKRLELARSLAVGPKLLLLDEVMGGLTNPEIQEIIGVLRRIHNSGVTVVMIEHIVEAIVALSQRVIVLNFGEKLLEGTPAEVMDHPAVIESYLGSDTHASDDQ